MTVRPAKPGTCPTLTLRAPHPEDEHAARAIHGQLAAEGFDFLLADGTWAQVLAQIQRESAGVDLPEGRVPADFLVAEVDGALVGRVSIRYELTDFLLHIGGHVGYAVAPQYRRRGYATQILRRALERLEERGVHRVLVTCDDDNLASARTIEACGGVLENVVSDGTEVPKRRYWIDNPA